MKTDSETWILNGILFTQDDQRNTFQRHLQIKNGKIEQITKTLPAKFSPDAQVVEARGLTLLPGFVQAHVHLCQTLFRNLADELELLDWLSQRIWPMEAAHTDQTLYTSALLGTYELLSSGTTCVLDMGTVHHTTSILEAVKKSGIRASVGKCLMDHPDQTPSYLRENTDTALREAVDLFEKWNHAEEGRIKISYAPRFAVSCTESLLREVAQLSNAHQALIHTHASENQKEVELVRKMTQMNNIEFFHSLGLTSPRLVLAHCIWLSQVEKDLIQKTKTQIVHCPSSNLKLASGICPVPELRGMGINVALGADGAPCNNNLNMFQEMRLAALIQKPFHGPRTLKAMEAIDMATRDGAKALGWFTDIGSIEEGKQADLIALNLQDPLSTVFETQVEDPEAIASSIVYSSSPSHLKWTMVGGEMVYQDGKAKNISSEQLIQDVQKAKKYILNRIH